MAPSFSMFVSEMVVNDVIFDYETSEPIELTGTTGLEKLDRIALAPFGVFYADGPLKTASVVIFAYPSNGPVLGKSRTSSGNALLQKLQDDNHGR